MVVLTFEGLLPRGAGVWRVCTVAESGNVGRSAYRYLISPWQFRRGAGYSAGKYGPGPAKPQRCQRSDRKDDPVRLARAERCRRRWFGWEREQGAVPLPPAVTPWMMNPRRSGLSSHELATCLAPSNVSSEMELSAWVWPGQLAAGCPGAAQLRVGVRQGLLTLQPCENVA